MTSRHSAPWRNLGYNSVNWNSKADVNIVNLTTGAGRHMKVDIRDLVAIAKSGSQNQKFELFLEKGEGSVCFPPLRVT